LASSICSNRSPWAAFFIIGDFKLGITHDFAAAQQWRSLGGLGCEKVVI
jgi:hypothetical protein